jgi:hypothetical protein
MVSLGQRLGLIDLFAIVCEMIAAYSCEGGAIIAGPATPRIVKRR